MTISFAVILAGRLTDVRQLTDVLQLVGWYYEPTSVALDDARGERLGTIDLRGGYVLGATCGELCGRDAFHALFADRADKYVVRRLTTLDERQRPVGSLAGLLMEVLHGITPLTDAAPW